MYQVCARILDRETELLNSVEAAQKRVREAVVRREWADFERLQSAMDRIGAELAELEGERKALFGEFPPPQPGFPGESGGESGGPGGEGGFYRLIAGLSPEEQRDLTGKYRELRMAGLRVRINNDNLLAYTGGIRAAVSAFIESAFPDRKGRVYSRSGAVVPQDMRSMVLNRSF
ncbi:MAG: hypothetical protein LBH51_00300 [Treponema sp.]|jgi:hypothetical protein|nr:hypothetical protein [Treponema sp.]